MFRDFSMRLYFASLLWLVYFLISFCHLFWLWRLNARLPFATLIIHQLCRVQKMPPPLAALAAGARHAAAHWLSWAWRCHALIYGPIYRHYDFITDYFGFWLNYDAITVWPAAHALWAMTEFAACISTIQPFISRLILRQYYVSLIFPAAINFCSVADFWVW